MGYYTPIIGQGFLGNMLELRNQRLKESLAEAEMQQEGMQMLGKGIGQMFGAFGQGAQQMGQDRIANRLMNEVPGAPRAGAVDVPWSDKQALSVDPGYATGGMTEMGLRLKMAEARQEAIRANAYQKQVDQARAQFDIKSATDAWTQTDKKLDAAYKERTAYIKEDSLLDNALSKAEDPVAYKAAVDKKVALNQAAMDRGLKGVEPLDPSAIPPFMTPQEKKQLELQRKSVADAQQAISAAESAPAGMWDQIRSSIGLSPESNVLGIPVTFDKERAVKEAQAKFKQEQETLSGLKGADFKTPEPKAPVSEAATGAQGAGSGIPVGHKQVHPQTGRTRTWDGSKWIYGQ